MFFLGHSLNPLSVNKETSTKEKKKSQGDAHSGETVTACVVQHLHCCDVLMSRHSGTWSKVGRRGAITLFSSLENKKRCVFSLCHLGNKGQQLVLRVIYNPDTGGLLNRPKGHRLSLKWLILFLSVWRINQFRQVWTPWIRSHYFVSYLPIRGQIIFV